MSQHPVLVKFKGVSAEGFLKNESLPFYEDEITTFIGAENAEARQFFDEIVAIRFGESQLKFETKEEDFRVVLSTDQMDSFVHLSVFNMLALTLKLIGIRSQTHLGEEIEKALRLAHFWRDRKSFLHTPIRKLNRLDRAKVSLARSLMFKPNLLLLDDPTRFLGPSGRVEFEDCIEKLKVRTSIAWSTSDMEQSARVSDRVVVFKEGKLLEFGLAGEIFTTPKKKQTEWFITRREYEPEA